MSNEDRQTDENAADTVEEDASFDDVEDEVGGVGSEDPTPYVTGPETPKKPRGRGFVAWLALLVSLGALAGVAYLVLLADGDDDEIAEARDARIASLAESVRQAQESTAALDTQLGDLASRDAAMRAEMSAIERRLQESWEERLEDLGSFPGRLRNIEDTMASLQGISSGVRDTWLIAEAEYYMQIANAQLQLAGTPHLAALALRLADERVLQLADPALTDVRRALSDELAALEVMEKPDIEGMTLTLASLAGVVESLPLRQEVAVPEREAEGTDNELSGFDRAVDSLQSALSDVVSVRRADEAMQPLIAPEAQYFLRANLALQLQAARLALLRGEQAVFEQSLDDASSWLDAYYDTESAQVQSAQQTIAEIRANTTRVAPPDISGSLRLLRQFDALNDAATEEQPGAGPAQ